MALKFKVATLDDVPEALRALYVKRDGAYVLDAEGAVDTDRLAEAERSRGQFAKENAKLIEFRKKLEEHGVPVDDEEELDHLVRTRETQKAKATEVDKLQGSLKEAEKRATKSAEKAQRYFASLRQAMIRNEAMLALGEHKGSAKLLLPVIEAGSDFVETEDGRFEVQVLDNFKQARRNDRNELIPIAAWVAEMKNDKEYARAFDGGNGSGGGAPAGGAGGGQRSTGSPDMTGWSPEQKLAWVHRNPTMAKQMAAAP